MVFAVCMTFRTAFVHTMVYAQLTQNTIAENVYSDKMWRMPQQLVQRTKKDPELLNSVKRLKNLR